MSVIAFVVSWVVVGWLVGWATHNRTLGGDDE
jgi:hypothetical protein